MDTKTPIIIKREVEVVVSTQALTVLEYTPFSPEEFIDWMLSIRKISFGGANVIEFIEAMSRKEENLKSQKT